MTIDKKNTLGGIFLTIGLLICCLISPHYFMSGFTFPVKFFISRISIWILVGLMFIYAAKIEKQPVLLWGEQKRGFIFYIVSIFALLGIVFVGGVAIGNVIKQLGWGARSNMVPMIMGLSFQLRLLAVVTAAFTEEIIVRGYLMPRLQLFFKGPVWPIVISSLIFGLGHMGFGTVVNVVIPLFIGLVFACHYYKYRNIKVLIICHFLIDFLSVIVIPGHK